MVNLRHEISAAVEGMSYFLMRKHRGELFSLTLNNRLIVYHLFTHSSYRLGYPSSYRAKAGYALDESPVHGRAELYIDSLKCCF